MSSLGPDETWDHDLGLFGCENLDEAPWYKCICPADRTGKHCEIMLDVCEQVDPNGILGRRYNCFAKADCSRKPLDLYKHPTDLPYRSSDEKLELLVNDFLFSNKWA